jgi:hypothetical protein
MAGEEDEGSEIAFKVLRCLKGAYDKIEKGQKVPTVDTLYDQDEMKELGFPAFNSGFFKHVADIFQRPVFQRI